MKNAFIFLLSLLLELVNAEIFTPEEINENDLAETANSSLKEEDSPSGDPFASNLINEEEKDQSNQETGSNLTENTASYLSQASEEGIETISALSNDDMEKKESLSEENQTPEQKTSLASSGSKEKLGVPYWTKVVLNKKTRDVLVNVKTVTIIESLGGTTASTENVSKTTEIGKAASTATPKSTTSLKNATTSKVTSTSASATPYIKIQMPSSKSSVSVSASKISSAKKPEATSSLKSTSKSKASQSKSMSSSLKKTTSVSKNDAFTKHTSDSKSSTQYKTTSTDSGSSMGSIFDVLRSLPSGGSGTESVFVEGTFKFPKEKEMKKKVFKLSGYIASN